MKPNKLTLNQNMRWLTRAEAAEYARLSIDKIDDLAKAHLINSVKTNSAKCGRVLIEKASIDRYYESLMKQVRMGERA